MIIKNNSHIISTMLKIDNNDRIKEINKYLERIFENDYDKKIF